MKKNRLTILLAILFLSAFVLSSCAGGAGVATGWPSISVDTQRSLAYVAYNQEVYAVSLDNGAEKWRFPAQPEAKTTFYASPAVAQDGSLYLGSYDNKLYKIDASSGQPAGNSSWPFAAASRFIASPLVTDGMIYAPNADQHLYALGADGKQLWKYQTAQPLWATPATDGKLVYQPSMDHHIYALSAASGELAWKSEDLGGAMVGTPTLGKNGMLYVGTFSNELLALSAADGKVAWRVPTTGWVWAGPTLDGGKLYFGDLKGTLYAVDAATGSEVWKNQPQEGSAFAIPDHPLVVNDTVYYTSENGSLNAVDIATGTTRWSKTVGGDKPGKLYGSPRLAGEKTILVAPVGIEPLLVALDLEGNQTWTYTPAKK